jgi:monoamine oxidase
LVAYPKSGDSARVTAMKESERISYALEQVEQVYPGMRENFEGAVTKCWDEDPWSQGAYAMFKKGQVTEFAPHLARPEGRIYFAGEHTSIWRGGWMQGALESGNRVAKQISETP